jgi:CRP-like cAMP-binding protein
MPAKVEQNALLRGRDAAAALERATPMTFARGTILWEAGAPASSVLFPESGLISHVVVMHDGESAEAGLVGYEGVTPVATLLGADVVTYRVVAQADTRGLLVDAAAARHLFDASADFRCRVLAYARSAVAQLAQTTACNRLHPARERLARWLLMCHDRIGVDTLPLTHEFIGNMLGTDRSLVTVTIGKLVDEGVLLQERGQLLVVDRAGLEAAACECYAVVRDAFDVLYVA